MLVLAPASGSVLPVPFGRIASVTEPEPFTVRLTLAGGDVIELGRLGVMRTQLLAELRDGRAATPRRRRRPRWARPRCSRRCGGPGEVRVYDDALLVIGDGGSERVSFSFAGAVRVQDYTVTVEVAGLDPVVLTRLGRRTDRAGRPADHPDAGGRRPDGRLPRRRCCPGSTRWPCARPPGCCATAWPSRSTDLDGIHPGLAGTLIQVATRPDRRDAVAELGRRAGLAIGFRQLTSVRRPAVGAEPWHDHAATPHIGEHESTGGRCWLGGLRPRVSRAWRA